MSDQTNETADQARALVEQAQALAEAENYRGAYRTIQEAVAIFERLLQANGNGATVSLEEFRQLQAERDRIRDALIATLPEAPPEMAKDFEAMLAGNTIPADRILAEIEQVCRGEE
jgi:hypothetical protein